MTAQVQSVLVKVEIFDYIDSGTGKHWSFFVTGMLEGVVATGQAEPYLHTFALNDSVLHSVLQERGVDLQYANSLPEERKREPVLGLLWEEGTMLLVDGHHRIAALHNAGAEEFRAYLLPMSIWERYALPDRQRGLYTIPRQKGEW